MPEGDTIHRIAERMRVALGGRVIELAEALNPRSPLHTRASELAGRTLEDTEAFGKHLIAHFSEGLALHSHLGMNGRWFIAADGRAPHGRPWLTLASGRGIAAQRGGKILRLVSESRVRNDPGLRQLGPDPLRPGFDVEAATARVLGADGASRAGEVLLDQSVIAGIGNVIANEACFAAGISPWRRIGELAPEEAEDLVRESERIMRMSLRVGRRPHNVYRARRCARCGGPISSGGQGDANRSTYWCPACQT
jgi:endonuclease VIII